MARPLREITEAMKEQIQNGDWETAHSRADDLLIEALRRLVPYATDTQDEDEVESLIATYDEVGKWYA